VPAFRGIEKFNMKLLALILSLLALTSFEACAFTGRLVSTTQNGYWFPAISNGHVVFRAYDGTLRLVNGETETIIVQNGDPAPSGGTFTNVNNNVAVDIDAEGTVAFVGETTSGEGIFQYKNGLISTIATAGTNVPSAQSTFSGFEGTSIGISDGNTVFVGYSRSGFAVYYGVYLFDGVTLSKVVDYTDLRPGNVETYANYFSGVDIDSGKIVFLNGFTHSGGVIYRHEIATNVTTAVMRQSDPAPLPNNTCHFFQIDQDPAISNGEIAAWAYTDCNLNGSENQMTLTSVSQGATISLRVSTLGGIGTFQGQSIDGTDIVTNVQSDSNKLVLDANGVPHILITDAGITDDNGAVIKPLSGGTFIFGDRGLSKRKLVFAGMVNNVPGIVELDIDGAPSNNDASVPFLPPWALMVLGIGLLRMAMGSESRTQHK